MKKVSLKTDSQSLYEIQENIFDLIHNTTDEKTRKIITQLVDYYQKIMLCLPGNVYWLDQDTRGIGCNQNVLNMFGLSKPEEFYRLTFEQMANLGDWNQQQGESFKHDSLDVIHSGRQKSSIEEPPIPNTNGDLTYFLTTRVPLFNQQGKVMGVVGISTDITQQKKVEKELRHAKQAAEIANRLKTEFFENMSHDIKTPLIGIIGLSDAMLHHTQDLTLRENLSAIHQSSQKLLDFFNSCLEVSSSNQLHAEFNQERFNIRALIDDVVGLFSPAIKNKNLLFTIDFSGDVPKTVLGSRSALYRILQNIVGNAIKFTDQGSIHLLVRSNQNETDPKKISICFITKDTGIGIPQDKLTFIFDKMSKLHASSQGLYEGHGFGLYIAKKYTDQLNGSISVKSAEGEGTQFTVVIPCEIDPSELPEPDTLTPQVEPTNSHTGLKVLLVEDNKVAAYCQKKLLSRYQHHVDVAINGRSALAFIKKKLYDIIFLDIGLPDIDGYSVAQQVRQLEKKMNKTAIPIIALTAHATYNNQNKFVEFGINTMLEKPLTVMKINKVLANYPPKMEN